MPPMRIELTTPGLQDQCSATELKRLDMAWLKTCTKKKQMANSRNRRIYDYLYQISVFQ